MTEEYTLEELLNPDSKKTAAKVTPSTDPSTFETVKQTYNAFWTQREKDNAWAEKEMSTAEFAERYRAFAVTRPDLVGDSAADYADMTHDDLRNDMYEYGTMRNNNSIGLGRDLIDVATQGKHFKNEWNYFEKVFHAAPVYGKYRSGWQAAGDIGRAVVTEPLNLFGMYGVWRTGMVQVNKAFAKIGVGGVVKEEYVKQVKKAAWKAGALNTAKLNAGVSVGLDSLKQVNQKIADPNFQFNPYRTAISAFGGAVTGYPMGALSAKISLMQVNPDTYFNTGTTWIKIADLGMYDGKPVLSLKDQVGFVVNSDGVKKVIPVEKGSAVSDADGNIGEVIKIKYADKEALEQDITVEFTDTKGVKTTKVVKETEVFAQDTESLPTHLQHSKPNYNYRETPIELEFENDIVKALYIVGGKGKSKSHDEFIDFLKRNNVQDIEIQAAKLRDYIKSEAKQGYTDVKVADYHAISKRKLPKNVEEVNGEGIEGGVAIVGEARALKAKENKTSFERTAFRNRNQMTDPDVERFNGVMAFISKNYKTLKGTNKYIKEFRVVTRKLKDLLDDFELRANIKINQQTRDIILRDAIDWAKTGKEGGVNLIAARIQNAMDLDNLSQKIAQTEAASTRLGKIEALKQEEKALDDVLESIVISDRLQTVMSDNLTAAKVPIRITPAQQLKKDYIKVELKKVLEDKRVAGLDVAEKHALIKGIQSNLKNDDKMYKTLRMYEKDKSVDSPVSLAAWYNEFTTANLLGSGITHLVNITSAVIKINWDIGHNYVMSMRMYGGGKIIQYNTFQSAGAKRIAQREIQLAKEIASIANDKLAMEFTMFSVAIQKAALSWRKQRSIGDIYNTKYNDGRIEQVHALYTAKLKESNDRVVRAAGHGLSWISNASYMTFRALGAGDTFMKQMSFNAARIAMVNHRMRKRYPELWAARPKKGRIFKTTDNPTTRIKTQGKIDTLEAAIRFEESSTANRRLVLTDLFRKKGENSERNLNILMTKKDRIQMYKDDIKRLKAEDASQKTSDFETTWMEMFDEYQDEFGNFVTTDSFTQAKLQMMDDTAKNPLFDPTYTAREATFTSDLTSPLVPHAKDSFSGSTGGSGQRILDWGYRHPFYKTLLGVNFVRTPIQLNRMNWHYTPIANKFHYQFKAQLESPDTLIREHAETTKAIAWALYGWSMHMYMKGDLIGEHKDPEKRNSLRLADGNFLKHDRLFPFGHSLTTTAYLMDKFKEFPDIWDDPIHATAVEKLTEFTEHTMGMTTGFLNVTLNSQLVTNQAFDLINGFMGATGSEYEIQETSDALSKFGSSFMTKQIPLGTTFKWFNRELAQFDHELTLYGDKVAEASPHIFIKEITGMETGFQPKRTGFYKIKDKVKGYVPFVGATQFDNLFKYSAIGVADAFKTEAGLERYLEMVGERPRADTNYSMLGRKIADLTVMEVSQYRDPNTDKIVKAREGQSFADLRLQIAGELKIMTDSGNYLTIGEVMSELLDNPNNVISSQVASKVIGGKRDDTAIINGIHLAFEEAAKHYLVMNAYSLIEGKQELPLLNRMNEFGGIYAKEYTDHMIRAQDAIKALTIPYQ